MLAASALLIACNKPVPEPEPEYEEVTSLEGVIAPSKMGYNGGVVSLALKVDVQTKADTTFLPWKYRVILGGEECDPVEVKEKTEILYVEVPGNYTLDERQVEVQMTDCTKQEDEWSTVASFPQEAGVVRMAFERDFDTFWAKGNIDIEDGKFIVAENYSDPGLLFSADSKYGVKAEDYTGTAYNPEPVQIALADIAGQPAADPCKLISENFRTPSYADFYYLEDINYADPSFDWVGTVDGMKGIRFKGSDFFLPFSGVVSRETGAYSLRGSNAGYWFMGGNAAGEHSIYTVSEDYTSLYYDLVGTNMASVRCVLDRQLPSYQSHSFDKEMTDKQMFMTVKVDVGSYPIIEVLAECVETGIVSDASATATTDAVVNIPANKLKEEVEWKIFVNRVYTGVSFKQPAMSDYAAYVSHTPASNDYTAFTLAVTIDTDRDNVPVTVKGAGDDITLYGSKDKTTVEFSIPENTANVERTLQIWVDSKDTKKTVKQGAAPAGGLSVEWAPGALKVVDGAYVFADSKERGMLFKYGSKYAIEIVGNYGSSSQYPGYAYAPAKTTVAYADIPTGEIDPCSLVAPANTWRLPTKTEMEEIKAADNGKTFLASTYNSKLDGNNEVIFVGGGQMNDTGTGISLPTTSVCWTSTEGTKAGQYVYGAWTMTSATGNFLVSGGGAAQTKAMQVRCVRSKK